MREEKNTTANSKKSSKESTRKRTTTNDLPKDATAQNAEIARTDKSEVAIKKTKASTQKESTIKEKDANKEKALVNNNGQIIIQKEVIKIAAAAEIKNRQIETIQTVEIAHDSLVLTLYDNGTVDGDTVSVLINGKVVWPRVGLLATATNKTIHLESSDGDSLVVVMYAENLGSIAPNTGLLVVRDGDKNYEIRFSGDLQKNSAIILKRKKKP